MRNISNIRAAKPIPQRTCVACRRTKTQRELVRLVRTTAGSVEIDRWGKREGRGAYLCPERACWEAALKGKQLEQALRASLTNDNRERLIASSRDFQKRS